MGSSDENYDSEALGTFTAQQRIRLQALHQRLDVKFDEIASFLAKKLGYSEADPGVDEEATEAIERWEEDIEMADNPIEPTDSLQRLLAEHHSIAEEILDIRELGLGIDD